MVEYATEKKIMEAVKALYVLGEQNPHYVSSGRFDADLFRSSFMQVAHRFGIYYFRSVTDPSAEQLESREQYGLHFRLCKLHMKSWWSKRQLKRIKELQGLPQSVATQLELLPNGPQPSLPPPWFEVWRENFKKRVSA